MQVTILGGTGLIGRKLDALLRARGHGVTVASPSTGVDLTTGIGLAAALEGAEVVVDVVNSPSFEDQAVMRFFESAGGQIFPLEVAAGVRHHLALSVVGADRIPDSGYMRAKLAQERAITASPIPFTLLRATQFFEFIGPIAASCTTGDTVRVTDAAFQPVAADDVAACLAELVCTGKPAGLVELAGPESAGMDDLIRRFLDARRDPRTVVTDRSARYFGALLDDRSLVPCGVARLGPTPLGAWLAR